MNADTCPRCGLPENWMLRVRLRLVYLSIVTPLIIGVAIGVLARWA